MFENPANGKQWDKSVLDLGLEILCVSQVCGPLPSMHACSIVILCILNCVPFSQFTLCHVLKGNKPDFHNAMNSDLSGPMYQDFLKLLGSMYKPEAIKGDHNMNVHGYNCTRSKRAHSK